jgi:hypothetical protein
LRLLRNHEVRGHRRLVEAGVIEIAALLSVDASK